MGRFSLTVGLRPGAPRSLESKTAYTTDTKEATGSGFDTRDSSIARLGVTVAGRRHGRPDDYRAAANAPQRRHGRLPRQRRQGLDPVLGNRTLDPTLHRRVLWPSRSRWFRLDVAPAPRLVRQRLLDQVRPRFLGLVLLVPTRKGRPSGPPALEREASCQGPERDPTLGFPLLGRVA